ncbi:CLU domain containing protein like protein, partial [Aduncisulcus paluster]
MQDPILHHGPLLKRSGLFGAWQLSDIAPTPGSGAKETTIWFDECDVIVEKLPIENKYKKVNAFTLTAEREYIFATNTKKELDEWLYTIENREGVIQQPPPGLFLSVNVLEEMARYSFGFDPKGSRFKRRPYRLGESGYPEVNPEPLKFADDDEELLLPPTEGPMAVDSEGNDVKEYTWIDEYQRLRMQAGGHIMSGAGSTKRRGRGTDPSHVEEAQKSAELDAKKPETRLNAELELCSLIGRFSHHCKKIVRRIIDEALLEDDDRSVEPLMDEEQKAGMEIRKRDGSREPRPALVPSEGFTDGEGNVFDKYGTPLPPRRPVVEIFSSWIEDGIIFRLAQHTIHEDSTMPLDSDEAAAADLIPMEQTLLDQRAFVEIFSSWIEDGIIFRLAQHTIHEDSTMPLDSDEAAAADLIPMEQTLLDQRACREYSDCYVPGLYIPLTTVIDYKGFRIVCMCDTKKYKVMDDKRQKVVPSSSGISITDIDDSTLVYGLSEEEGRFVRRNFGQISLGDRTVTGAFSNRVCSLRGLEERLRECGRKMNLKPHKIIQPPLMSDDEESGDSEDSDSTRGTAFTINVPIEIQVHRDPKNGRIVLLNLSRMFPADNPDLGDPERADSLIKLFRPEFLRESSFCKAHPLPCNVFSNLGNPPDQASNAKTAIQASRFLISSVVPQCAQMLDNLSSASPSSASSAAASASGNSHNFNLFTSTPFSLFSPGALSHILHTYGLSTAIQASRFLISSVVPQCAQMLDNLSSASPSSASSAAASASGNSHKLNLFTSTPFSLFSPGALSHILHTYGLSVSHLPYLLVQCKTSIVKQFVMAEMVARVCIRNLLTKSLRMLSRHYQKEGPDVEGQTDQAGMIYYIDFTRLSIDEQLDFFEGRIRETITEFFNLLVGAGHDSEEFWLDTVIPEVQDSFRLQSNTLGIAKSAIPPSLLMISLQYHSGVVLTDKSFAIPPLSDDTMGEEKIEDRHVAARMKDVGGEYDLFASSSPIDPADILWIDTRERLPSPCHGILQDLFVHYEQKKKEALFSECVSILNYKLEMERNLYGLAHVRSVETLIELANVFVEAAKKSIDDISHPHLTPAFVPHSNQDGSPLSEQQMASMMLSHTLSSRRLALSHAMLLARASLGLVRRWSSLGVKLYLVFMSIYGMYRDHTHALESFNYALRICVSVYGGGSGIGGGKSTPLEGHVWMELGSMWYLLGEFERALEAFSKAHKIATNTLGNSHKITALYLTKIGHVHRTKMNGEE